MVNPIEFKTGNVNKNKITKFGGGGGGGNKKGIGMGGKNSDRYIPYITSHKAYKNTTNLNININDISVELQYSDPSSPVRLSSPEFFHDLRNTGHYQAIEATSTPVPTMPQNTPAENSTRTTINTPNHLLSNGTTNTNNSTINSTNADSKIIDPDQKHRTVIADSLGFLNFKRVYTFTDKDEKSFQDGNSLDLLNLDQLVSNLNPTDLMSHLGKKEINMERCSTPIPLNRPVKRIKSHVPYRVLDAPNLRNDFYSNLICWSKTTNNVVVGLGPCVYIWSDIQGAVPIIEHGYLGKHHDYVTCVSFCPFSSYFLIGTKQGRLILFNQDDFLGQFNNQNLNGSPLVEIQTSSYRGIGCIEWFKSEDNDYSFMIGEESGEITFFDIISKSYKEVSSPKNNDCFPEQLVDNLEYILNTTKLHDVSEMGESGYKVSGQPIYKIRMIHKFRAQTQQICGMSLNEKCNLLAIGGNDNSCTVWDISNKKFPVLLQTLKHNAAVKAIAFCPWSKSLLATGGGSKDRTVKFWHAQTGTLLKKIKTKGQITSLIWSARYKQIVATFGFGDIDNPVLVMLYSYPQLKPILQVKTATPIRVLSGVASPDVTSICIAANDETIRFYKLWDENEIEIKEIQENGLFGSNIIEYVEGIDTNNYSSSIR